MNRTAIVVTLLLSVFGSARANDSAVGALKYTSITYDRNIWNVILNNTDAQGGSNFSVKHLRRPIVVGISERPDRTLFMVSGALLKQMEDGQRTNMHRFEPADPKSAMYMLRTPGGWNCKHNIAESNMDIGSARYYSHCVSIGSGYWNYIVVVAPLDVTPSEIQAINDVLLTVVPTK